MPARPLASVPGRAGGRRYSVGVTPDGTDDEGTGADDEPTTAPGEGSSVTDGAALERENEDLEHDKEDLERQNEALRQELRVEHTAADRPKRRRGRTIGAWVLLVLACLLAVLSVVVVYARNELLNTDTFVSTLAPLAKNHAVQTAVATRVSDNLVAKTDLEQRIENALPPKASFLATPISSTVKSATYTIVLKLTQTSQFQTLWEQSLRRSHEQLDNLLTGQKVGALASSNGQVTVDLSQVETRAKQVLASHGLSVFNKVPQYSGTPYVLFQSEQLAKIQRWVKFLDRLAVVLPILAIILFAVSVLLAKDRRRGLVHAAAGLAVTMALLLVAANVGRNQYLQSLRPGQSKPATTAVIDTVDASLLDSVRTVLVVSFVVALVAFVVGLGPVRRWMADRSQPTWLTTGRVHDTVASHRGAFQWLVVVVGLVVLVLWDQPTAKVAVIVALVTLFVVVVVGLYGRSGAAATPRRPEPDRRPVRRPSTHRSGAADGCHRHVSRDGSVTTSRARRWWLAFEPVHAVVYFDPGCLAALDALGFRGFWTGYVAARAAPFGAVGPEPVTATFFNFHPTRAARALPEAWSVAAPADVWATRTHAAADALRRMDPTVEDAAGELVPALRSLFDGVPDAGRPLFAATRATGAPDDVVQALWFWCTCLREHRGDGHVAALTAAGLDGCEALVLFAADDGPPVELLQRSRGWSTDEWAYARDRLVRRGLMDGDAITPTGRDLRRWVETTTDDLAGMVTGRVDGRGGDAPLAALESVARAVHASGVIWYPNPMGLPEPSGP